MKSARLALLQIKTAFTRQRLLFCIYFLGLVLCMVVLIYYSGSGNRAKEFEVDNSFLTTYEVGISSTYYDEHHPQKHLDGEALAQMEENIPIPARDYLYKCTTNLDELKGVELSDAFLAQKNYPDSFVISAYRHNTMRSHAWVGRTEFTEEELLGAQVAVGPSELFSQIDPASPAKITLRGVPFTVIGAFPLYLDQWFFVPYQTLAEHFPITSVEIYLQRAPTQAENEEMKEFLTGLFPGEVIQSPDNNFNIRDTINRGSFVLSFALFLIAFFSMLFLMKYMLDQARQELVIYAVVGASKTRIFIILLLHNAVMVLLSGLTAIGIFLALKKPLFDTFSPVPEYQYTVGDFCGILLLAFVLSLLVSAPFLYRFARKTPTQLKNGAA